MRLALPIEGDGPRHGRHVEPRFARPAIARGDTDTADTSIPEGRRQTLRRAVVAGTPVRLGARR